VKTRGKGVPETKTNKYPNVETYREEINGHYWFPTYSFADEELVFEDAEPLHIKMKVQYSDFVPAHVNVNIREADDPTGASITPVGPTAVPANSVATKPAPKQIDRTQPIESGVLNKKAIELPDPVLPKEAPKYGGIVRVRVIVDEVGNVISAEIEDGRIELRRPALEAARKARFAPTLIDGEPVKITGFLTYLFVQ